MYTTVIFLSSQVLISFLHNGLGSQVQGLSTAALGYHQVVKENRNLYNALQDLKGCFVSSN